MCTHQPYRVLIKGAGEMATGVALRLWAAHFQVVMTETATPTTVRRCVAFSQAVFDGCTKVAGVTAVCVAPNQVPETLAQGSIPVCVDPHAQVRQQFKPDILVDAILAKKNTGTTLEQAPLVIALGPGFLPGRDAHFVIETLRGHYLGQVLTSRAAQPPTGVPGEIAGQTHKRVLRAPCAGVFQGVAQIGDLVQAGQVVAMVDQQPVPATLTGALRGLLADGLTCHAGMKVGDVDPRGQRDYCFTVSDKARALGGAVLEAILRRFPLSR